MALGFVLVRTTPLGILTDRYGSMLLWLAFESPSLVVRCLAYLSLPFDVHESCGSIFTSSAPLSLQADFNTPKSMGACDLSYHTYDLFPE